MVRTSRVPILVVAASVLVIAAAAFVFIRTGGLALFAEKAEGGSRFRTLLIEADAALDQLESASAGPRTVAAGPRTVAAVTLSTSVEARLDSYAKRARGADSELSVLKRRRRLSRLDPDSAESYAVAAAAAALRFPQSQDLAAVAAEALLSVGKVAEARAHALRLEDGVYEAVAAAALFARGRGEAGSFSGVRTADSVPNADAILIWAAASLVGPVGSAGSAGDAEAARDVAGASPASISVGASAGTAASACLVDAALLRLIRDDASGARALMAGADRYVRFLAELEYDFGDPAKAASMFSRLPDEDSLARRADSLFLAADSAGARATWRALLAACGGSPRSAGVLFNLAATADGEAERREYSNRLLASFPADARAVILYSRLDPGATGSAVLDRAERLNADVLILLERIRREAATVGPDRTVARLWLLMNATAPDERVERWAAWYMETYRKHDDLAALLSSARRRREGASWIDFHEALAAARSSRTSEARELLERAGNGQTAWHQVADLGVVEEFARSPRKALEAYGIAAALAAEDEDKSALRVNMARCLSALGKDAEARLALEYAISLDPGNLRARTELRKRGEEPSGQ